MQNHNANISIRASHQTYQMHAKTLFPMCIMGKMHKLAGVVPVFSSAEIMTEGQLVQWLD